ncbi:MAG: DUF2752 domain-containing protein [Candidatus Eisenbacteria bacterium]
MRRTDLLVLPLAVAGAAAAALAFFRFTPFARMASCPLRLLTGIPCPACGGTTAVSALLAGRWEAAARANPLVVFAAAAAALLAVASLAVIPWAHRIPPGFGRSFTRGRALGVLLILLAANWVYLFLALR